MTPDSAGIPAASVALPERWESLVSSRGGTLPRRAGRSALSLAAAAYGAAARARNAAYDAGFLSARPAGVPVISIGNLTVGGTGKTSLVLWCARNLLEKGVRSAVLSRGYGRTKRTSGPMLVSDGLNVLADAAAAGDEPVMLAAALPGVPVVAGADRAGAAVFAREMFRPDCLILDDGFQHRGLRRDFDVVCVDERMMDAPFLFPRGTLREPVASLGRAHFAVIKEPGAAGPAGGRFHSRFRSVFGRDLDLPSASFRYRASGFRENGTKRALPAGGFSGRPVLAASAIADPKSFEAALRDSGARIIRSARFPDHHGFSSGELDGLAGEARRLDAALVMTEKDLVKCPPGFPAWALAVELEWTRGSDELLQGILRAVRH